MGVLTKIAEYKEKFRKIKTKNIKQRQVEASKDLKVAQEEKKLREINDQIKEAKGPSIFDKIKEGIGEVQKLKGSSKTKRSKEGSMGRDIFRGDGERRDPFSSDNKGYDPFAPDKKRKFEW